MMSDREIPECDLEIEEKENAELKMLMERMKDPEDHVCADEMGETMAMRMIETLNEEHDEVLTDNVKLREEIVELRKQVLEWKAWSQCPWCREGHGLRPDGVDCRDCSRTICDMKEE
jgi:hypothetical protein